MCCFIMCCRMSRVACMTAISVMFCCMGLEESEMRLGILLRKWLRKYANSLARSSVLMLQKVRYIGSDLVVIWTPKGESLLSIPLLLTFEHLVFWSDSLFCIILTVNSLFLNSIIWLFFVMETLCFLWGMKCIVLYYIVNVRVKRINNTQLWII